MEKIKLNIEKVLGFVSKETVASYEAKVKECIGMLENGTGKGNDFLGWLHLPSSISKEMLKDLEETAETLRDNCEVVVVAGIGGSYLGARAVIEALSNSFAWLQKKKKNQRKLKVLQKLKQLQKKLLLQKQRKQPLKLLKKLLLKLQLLSLQKQ